VTANTSSRLIVSSLDCEGRDVTWDVLTNEQSVIELTIHDMRIDDDERAQLLVYDGSRSSSNLIFRSSDGDGVVARAQFVIRSSSNKLLIDYRVLSGGGADMRTERIGSDVTNGLIFSLKSSGRHNHLAFVGYIIIYRLILLFICILQWIRFSNYTVAHI